MAKECIITGKKSQVGGRYSNRTRATQFNSGGKKRRQVNLQKKTVFIPEIGAKVSGMFSTKAIKTMAKKGPYQTFKDAGLI